MTMQNIPPGTDPVLWEIATRRTSFKTHLRTYLVFVLFFWVIYFLSGAPQRGILPWPVWPMLGWGIGVIFHYVNAYVNTGLTSVEKEYEKLKQQRQH